MKWHVTVETVDAVHEFDLPVKEARDGYVPFLRKMDTLGITQHDVVKIELELQND